MAQRLATPHDPSLEEDTVGDTTTEEKPQEEVGVGARPRCRAHASEKAAYVTIKRAAEHLDLDPNALRARCRRAAAAAPGAKEVELGGGIVAIKFGRSWRIRFPR